jgi:cytochrome bd-type quinol oxidase subunit 1
MIKKIEITTTKLYHILWVNITISMCYTIQVRKCYEYKYIVTLSYEL